MRKCATARFLKLKCLERKFFPRAASIRFIPMVLKHFKLFYVAVPFSIIFPIRVPCWARSVLLNYILQGPPMERENISCPPFAKNESIIYRNSLCIPVPRSHTHPLQHFIAPLQGGRASSCEKRWVRCRL